MRSEEEIRARIAELQVEIDKLLVDKECDLAQYIFERGNYAILCKMKTELKWVLGEVQ